MAPPAPAPPPSSPEIAQLRGEIKGVKEELRLGLERLSGSWAVDAKERHDLTGAIKTLTVTTTELATTTTKHDSDLKALKEKQVEDDHEKTRAKTALTIGRSVGGALVALLLSLGGYLLRSYIEVRDQTRDHTADLATLHEEHDRLEAAHAATETDVREGDEEAAATRTRLDSIDQTLIRIEESLDRRRR